ncbi:MAG: hypothetical protein MZW92_69600 [Comamonadaceae bacterium]|nr:hypothetical protein [Comamonadaceae bacterium]
MPYGVIDERLNTGLVGELLARPDRQIVMVGPVVKIDPAALPRRQNLHWLGMQGRARCTSAGWDVAIMPFAINDATRFISPTKTLEYMAADKPIVSTPVRDVVAPYGGIVLGRRRRVVRRGLRCPAQRTGTARAERSRDARDDRRAVVGPQRRPHPRSAGGRRRCVRRGRRRSRCSKRARTDQRRVATAGARV